MKSRKIINKWSVGKNQTAHYEQLYYENYKLECDELVKSIDEEILQDLFDIARITINNKKYIINSYRHLVNNYDNLEYINIICKLNKKL